MCSCSGSCNCNSTTIPRGPQGIPGQSGTNGTNGNDGIDGVSAIVDLGTVNTGLPGTEVIITNTGPTENHATFNFSIPQGEQGEQGLQGDIGPPGPAGTIVDTGWLDLQGFSYYDLTSLDKPQVRQIGNVLHFRGRVIIPLSDESDGTPLVPMSDDFYLGDQYAYVFQGTANSGGCTVNSGGALYFRKSLTVLPTTITDLPDYTYSLRNILATRRIQINTGVAAVLNAVISVIIYPDGKLGVQTVKDIEIVTVGGTDLNSNLGTSPMRFLTSKVVAGQKALNWTRVGVFSTLHSDGSGTGSLIYDIDSISSEYNFSVDAAEPNNLGGFYFLLDGLSAFITI